MPPTPVADFFPLARVPLKANLTDVSPLGHEVLSTAQVRGHVFHFQLGEKVVLVGNVADGPQQASGNCFRLSLLPQFSLPFFPRLIADVKLGACTSRVFLQEFHRKLRQILLAAGAVIKIVRWNVSGIQPQDGLAICVG